MDLIKKFLFFWWRARERHEAVSLIRSRVKDSPQSMENEWQQINNDPRMLHEYNGRYRHFIIRTFFILFFILGIFYTMVIKNELYLSTSSIIVQDMVKESSNSFGSVLLNLGGNSSQKQDSKIVETYLRSYDMLKKLDYEFGLRDYYEHNRDPLHRLYKFSSTEYFLYLYQKDIEISYDEVSGIMTVGFPYSDREISQKIVAFLIHEAENQLNVYNHRNAGKYLAFIRSLVEENKLKVDVTIKQMEAYQNSHRVLDPQTDAQTQSSILSNLQSTLIDKKTQRDSLLKYMKETSFDVVNLSNEISQIEAQIITVKSTMTGVGVPKLNRILINFDRLKAQVDFDKNVYTESLAQLELAQIEVNKQAKTLVVLTEPNLPDTYTYPHKLLVTFNLLLIMILIYGITMQLSAIIKDHKD
ncbi:MAG: hypothetical protein PHQ35_10575 [Phycisphaerae bacterium]|nr:hypothetical protein [Phycisphaerae bacterium]